MSNDQKSADLNVLEKIKNALGTECPQCNEINPITLSHCDKCGTVLPFPGEEISTISYVDSERPHLPPMTNSTSTPRRKSP